MDVIPPNGVRACPGCDSKNSKAKGVKEGFSIRECGKCRSIFTATIPVGEEKLDYDDYYSEVNLSVPDFIHTRVAEIIGQFEGFRKTNRMLDIGFGAGTMMNAAIAQGWESFGTEVSKAAVVHAERNGLKVFHGVLEDAKYPDEHFDVVTASEIIEHVDDAEAMLKEVARILRPGGCFWATTPSSRSLSYRLTCTAWTVISPPEHIQLYSPVAVRKLLQRAGFKDIQTRTNGLNIYEIRSYYANRGRKAAAGGEEFSDRVGSSYALNEAFTKSGPRRIVKQFANFVLSATTLGDSLKIRAIR